ncbi:MAG: ABC transporter ATP-binding protein [Nitrososphaeria archaeon]
MSEVLRVEGLKMYYKMGKLYVKAVDDVTFTVEKGTCLGLAGESGSGKTSIANTIMRLLPRNAQILSGKIYIDGQNVLDLSEEEFRRIRWVKIAMVPQASMNAFDPVFTIGDQIAEAIITHRRVSKEEAMNRVRELFELVGIDPKRVNSYPHEFSGGMKQRAAIAMALANNPDVLILDEPTTALDVIVQAQVLSLLRDLKKKLNIGMMLITHDLSIIADLCDKVAIFYAGKVVEYGNIYRVYENPLHPYTKGLLGAFPNIRAKRQRLVGIPGAPPNLASPPSGCRFHPRCPYAFDKCKVEEPKMKEVEPGHFVACHLYDGERNA